ncbi:MAG: DUF3786 domain-containing protein [Candidatus Bipolaricaulota bacterium]
MASESWRSSLRPRIAETRAALAQATLDGLVQRGGLVLHPDGMALDLVGKRYVVRWPELVVVEEATGEESPEELQALVLDYLVGADGSSPTGRWLGFRELPHGGFYWQAFQGYSGDDLARSLNGDTASFRRGAERLAGSPVALGDAAYAFRALPNVPLAVVWWQGDEEFPPRAAVLFDAVDSHYLPTDGLAILGRMLCRRLIKLGTEQG